MDGIVYRNKTLKVKEKNNICFRASNVFNNYFSDLKVKDVGAFYQKAMMFCDKKNDSEIHTSYPDKKKFSEQLEILKNNDSMLLFEKINENLE